MSKGDGCKVASVCKHKERKPKKPHYIPRPWGKPYNYKCFQCPFTCMEKSHLYNHMKYSLCKNSLSLLIESDWPYKKGNVLHPDQLRPLQQAHGLLKEDPGPGAKGEEKPRQRRPLEEDGEEPQCHGAEDEEGGGELTGQTREGSGVTRRDRATEGAKKPSKRQESELLMADMFSLEDQVLRARSVEVEAQLKQYKLSKSRLTAPGLLSEQWRLLSSHTKPKAEGLRGPVGSSIPCYPPPPPNLLDYQDPTGLSLSLLGVGYPISPGLFSYMNATLPGAMGASAHAQIAQLPFLAAGAHLVHPASGAHQAHADRTHLAPRLFYPFLCEHALGATPGHGEAKGLKAGASSLDGRPLPSYQPKVGQPVFQAGWISPQRASPDAGTRALEKPQSTAREDRAGWGLKREGALLGMSQVPVEKRPAMGFTLDMLENIQNASPLTTAADELLLHRSLQSRPEEQWQSDPPASPNSESSSRQDCTTVRTAGAGSSESVAGLLNDLSKALQEYQEAERKISRLEKDDLPAQGRLWEHINKIRSELFHIHQALEQTALHNEGPLDLSVKREPGDVTACVGAEGDSKDITTETEEDDDDGEDKEEEEADAERKATRASTERCNRSMDMLIKMSQAGGMFSAEVLGSRHGPTEAPWLGRTTKCEADSSVLLCADGRPTAFTDIPASAPKRPAAIRCVEAQRPPSPLTATDS